jgi:hypothetical protein
MAGDDTARDAEITSLRAELGEVQRSVDFYADQYARAVGQCGVAVARAEAAEAEAERLREALEKLALKNDQQAACLEHYAEQQGQTAKPVPSVYHLQAMHFRDIATEARTAQDGGEGKAVTEPCAKLDAQGSPIWDEPYVIAVFFRDLIESQRQAVFAEFGIDTTLDAPWNQNIERLMLKRVIRQSGIAAVASKVATAVSIPAKENPDAR